MACFKPNGASTRPQCRMWAESLAFYVRGCKPPLSLDVRAGLSGSTTHCKGVGNTVEQPELQCQLQMSDLPELGTVADAAAAGNHT